MLIFAISTKLHLTKKPAWVDPFRTKYGQAYEYHVTLKQPCLIDDVDVERIKTKLAKFFQSYAVTGNQLSLIFDTIVVESESDGRITIMVNAEKNAAILKLQKEILNLFPNDTHYRYPESKAWEQNFKPHVTIAADLERLVYEEARKEIGKEVRCEGYIDAVTLDLVREKDGAGATVDRIEFRF